ncbi:MAG: hypothetical protein ACKVX7_08285 [Planctomycetota bacterium]
MRLPTATDISPRFGTDYEGNDERCAREHFLGKSLDEAEALFRQNALYYVEDLLCMGAPAFRYYVPAFIRYIRSEHSRRDPVAINCFAGLLEQRTEQTIDVARIANELADACRYVLDHYDKFEADPSIYGDLRSRYESLVSRLREIHVG